MASCRVKRLILCYTGRRVRGLMSNRTAGLLLWKGSARELKLSRPLGGGCVRLVDIEVAYLSNAACNH